MKKAISLFVVFVMLFACMSPAYASDTNTTEVSLTVDPSLESYTLTIPPSVTIDPATKTGQASISCTIENMVWSKGYVLGVKFKNIDSDGLYLVNSDDSDLKIKYYATLPTNQMVRSTSDTASQYISSDSEKIFNVFLAYPDSNIDLWTFPLTETDTITATVDGTYPGGGTYTDTWTFTFQFLQSE